MLFGCYRWKLQVFLDNHHLLLLTRRHFGGVNSSKGSQDCHILVYSSNYLRIVYKLSIFFSKKIMENMAIIPWSFHEWWRPCQETWQPCRHHGMIMIMFRHDHGMAAMFFQPGGLTQIQTYAELMRLVVTLRLRNLIWWLVNKVPTRKHKFITFAWCSSFYCYNSLNNNISNPYQKLYLVQ